MAKDVSASIRDILDKRFGKRTAVSLKDGGALSEPREVIPTGLGPLDWGVLGVGGFPVGRMVEVFGNESTGKTSLALAVCAGATKAGGVAVFCDAEHALEFERVPTFGVDLDRFIFLQPDTMELAVDQMRQAIEAIPKDVGPNVVVFDSIAASTPKAELEGEAGDSHVALQARLVGRMCKQLMPILAKHRAHLLLLNQIRMKVGVMFGNPETTPGGNAPKFFTAARLRLTQGAKPENEHRDVKVKAVKNKLAKPHREAVVRLVYDSGFDDVWSTVNYAKDQELVPANTKASEKSYAEAREKLGWK